MTAFGEEFLTGSFSHFLCCYDYDDNSSEAIDKIATYQKDYRKCFLCVIVCFIAKAFHQ